jgi:putative SOS response-associated peptidase YedK
MVRFEWKQEVKGKKQPFFVKGEESAIRTFPWSLGKGGQPVDSDETVHLTTFTILTTEVAPRSTWLHTRMPARRFPMPNVGLEPWFLDGPTQQLHEALLKNNYSSSKMSFSHSNQKLASSTDAWGLACRHGVK